ncbi:regulator of G-protein signaling 17 isoform X2 [Neocloeon triangulifer]|uniref:regulator of G-protein signaling 17 isoform X2 n=1 Tax=Neocloeon triangulifer TaxID=2078957 RepID=UPI00286F85CC|nr:regulator of G-protein signaling 17 isoform X2 [Neocloeon triangulifer]
MAPLLFSNSQLVIATKMSSVKTEQVYIPPVAQQAAPSAAIGSSGGQLSVISKSPAAAATAPEAAGPPDESRVFVTVTTTVVQREQQTAAAADASFGLANNEGCRLRTTTTSTTVDASSPSNNKGANNATVGADASPQANNNAMAAVVAVPRTNKPCCFCWCCCCTCSCLAVKSSDELNTKNKEANYLDSLTCDGEPPPTLEDIRSWGHSFDKLMKSAAGRKVFRDFLKCEYSEENILFWLACEELKKESNPEVVEEKARFIYEDYISILSPKEVSLDSRVREVVNKNMVDPTPHTFDEAQLQIYTLMHRDSYPRFINSHIFKRLAQLNNNSTITCSGPGGAGGSNSPPPGGSSSSRKESFA